MRESVTFVAFAAFLSITACGSAWAQATAQISGTVRDQTGAVLPGTEVTATQTATGVARTAVTNETGSYVLPNLALGPYRLEATLPGFRTFLQTGIVLEVNSDPVINPLLEVGQVSEQVEVQANAAVVETRTVGVGQVVENARIMELPLNGRNVVDLIALAGNAAPAPLVTGQNRDSFATASYSVAGGINTGVTYILDGANNGNPSDSGYAPLPFPDALQEFKVETSATSAEKGMKTAAAVTMVTKSGTNELHGDLFEFVRNGIFNARNAFAAKRDTIKRNQFGGTFGGPIAKNRVFFFGGYQGTLLRQDPAQQVALIPTAAMLAGDFTAFTSPACNGGLPVSLKTPFVNNKINPAMFSRVALNLTAKLPTASADDCGKVIYGLPTKTNDHMMLGKIDYQHSANHSIFGRYFAEDKSTPSPFDINHNPLSMGVASRGLGQLFTLGDTYVFGPNVVNALRLTANRLADGKFEPDSMPTAGLGPVALGVKAFDYQPYTANWTVTNAFQITSQGGPTRSAIFGLADDLSVIRGNHQMGFGGNWMLWWANNYSGSQVMATTFNGGTTGLALTDFLLGDVFSFSNGPTKIKNKRGNLPALYAADTWKVKPNLTLSYGLRWEPYIPVVDLKGGPIHFDQNAFNQGIRSNQYDTTPPGVLFPGDPGFPLPEGQNKRWMNFSPRVGLAWDIKGDGRTSVRASVGSVYDYPFGQFLNLAGAPPFYPRNTLTNVNIDDPWANYPLGNGKFGDPFPLPYGNKLGRNPPFPLLSLVNVIDYNTKNPQSYQWNLNVQRLVGTGWIVSAGYLGTNATHIWSTRQYNPGVYFYNGTNTCLLPNGTTITGSNGQCSTTTNQEQRRRLTLLNPAYGQYYGFMPALDFGGTSSYNALSLSVQRRAVKGVTFNANYTLSHCISDPGGGTELVGSNNTTAYTNPDSRHFDRGNCAGSSTDIRHIFNLSGVAATPQFVNRTLRAFGSGWRFSPIFRVLSGDFLNVTTTQDRALTTTPTQRMNQVLLNPYGNKTAKNYLNRAAFAPPDLGTFAHTGANAIEGPGTWQFDAALSRTFQIREGHSVEFRWEAFNVINGFRMMDPVVNFNSGNFGQMVPSSTTPAPDPRIMQFGLKYVF
jgi:hypothetical protein